MSLKITDVQVYIPQKSSSILAMVTVVFNDLLKVTDYKIIKNKKGEPFVSSPSRSYVANDGTTKYINIVEVLGEEFGPEFSRQIMDAYTRKAQGTSAPAAGAKKTPATSRIPTEYKEQARAKVNSPAPKGQEKNPWELDDDMDQF